MYIHHFQNITALILVAFNLKKSLLVRASIESGSMDQMLASMAEAKGEGADFVELRIDSTSFSNISLIEKLIKQRTLLVILSLGYLCYHNRLGTYCLISFFFFFFFLCPWLVMKVHNTQKYVYMYIYGYSLDSIRIFFSIFISDPR
ncbi:Aldolase-type TIM barrel [Parasponia andersonii]|uniref:Aldolase-type TIM barrel n=1 Tax=Parasponia andersonii TaxID=3476 RepID=A0A2P5C869_PARAD|nr:Aldolase-type TIM barrel [Parasponia andersonii]